jgi:hypothetical protein
MCGNVIAEAIAMVSRRMILLQNRCTTNAAPFIGVKTLQKLRGIPIPLAPADVIELLREH